MIYDFTIFPVDVTMQSGFWFCLIFLFLFLEMGHPGLLYFISFSCGSLCSYVATLYGLDISWQLTLFIAGVCAALLLLHFTIKTKINCAQSPSHRSNIEALIGRKVIVVQTKHDNTVFQARVSGQLWLVRTVGDQTLSCGQQVVIVDVQGCHLRVDKI